MVVAQDTRSQPKVTEIDLRDVIADLIARKYQIAAMMLVGAMVAMALAFWLVPTYRATVILSPSSDSQSGSMSAALGSLGGLASLAGIGVGTDVSNPTEEALAVLRSPRFTQSFIREEEMLPVLFSKKWDAHAQRWAVEQSDEPTLGDGLKYLDDLRTIHQDKKTGLITLQVDWKDPELAAKWANKMVLKLNAEMAQRAVSRTDAYLNYLQEELRSSSVSEMKEAISRLIEAQMKQKMLAKSTGEYSFKVIEVAIPPPIADPIRPKKVLMTIVGAIIGTIIGAMFVIGAGRRRKAA